MTDAITLLKEDHQKVKKILEDLEKTTERGVKTREELFTKLLDELRVHEQIEEQIFYPACKEHSKMKDLILESYEEHAFVDTIAKDIEGVPFDDERWGAKLKVMMENIEHHAFEEEEGKLFPKVRQAFTKDEIEALGIEMAELKASLEEKAPEAQPTGR